MRNIYAFIFTCVTISTICGNVFAVSQYASTIQQNTPSKSFLTVASFPTTAADTSFVERMESKREGYQYFNRSAFSNLTIEEQDELETMFRRAEMDRLSKLRTSSRPVYCSNYPSDNEHCPETILSAMNYQQVTPESIYDNLAQAQSTPTTQSGLYMSMALTPQNVAMYNLKTHNGGCTPPEHSNWGRNYIQTSGRYENIDAPFEKFMITAFRKEGDCGTLENDSGGYTCYGCASKNGLCSGIDMKNVTRSMVEDLAYDKIYRAYHVDRLPDAFRGYAMWAMWGSGAVVGIKIFQAALNVPQTGQIDDATVRAAENYRGNFADTYVKVQEQAYRNIVAKNGKKNDFLRGWLNSLELLRPSGCHVVPTNPISR